MCHCSSSAASICAIDLATTRRHLAIWEMRAHSAESESEFGACGQHNQMRRRMQLIKFARID
jgi:hypothetical protein